MSTAAFSPSKTDQLYVINHNMGNGGSTPLYGSAGAGTSAWPRGSTLGINNVAGALVSSAAKIHVLLYNIFGFETGTLNKNGDDAKNASISYEGHTYGSNIGFFWYIDGLSGRFIPPPPTSDVKTSEKPGDLIRPAVKGGVKVVTPPLFTESSPVSAQVETEWSLNLDPTGMYLGEDGLFHEDGNPYTYYLEQAAEAAEIFDVGVQQVRHDIGRVADGGGGRLHDPLCLQGQAAERGVRPFRVRMNPEQESRIWQQRCIRQRTRNRGRPDPRRGIGPEKGESDPKGKQEEKPWKRYSA